MATNKALLPALFADTLAFRIRMTSRTDHRFLENSCHDSFFGEARRSDDDGFQLIEIKMAIYGLVDLLVEFTGRLSSWSDNTQFAGLMRSTFSAPNAVPPPFRFLGTLTSIRCRTIVVCGVIRQILAMPVHALITSRPAR